MKITRSQLKQIIKEELKEVLSEANQQLQFQKSFVWQKTLASLGNVLGTKDFFLESEGANVRGAMYIYRKNFDDGSKMRLKIEEVLR